MLKRFNFNLYLTVIHTSVSPQYGWRNGLSTRTENFMDIFEDLIDEGDKFASVDTGTGKQLSDLVRKLIEQEIE